MAPLIRSELCAGVVEDINSRIHLYLKDFDNIWNLKVSASILFMFFTSIGPAITFANLLQKETQGEIGAVEVMLSSAISGIIMSLFAGQPLVIVGVTGPVSILTISIYSMSSGIGIPFLPFYAWTQIWAALFHIIIAIINLCDLLSWISRFSCEIFGVLIAVIYIYTGLYEIQAEFINRDFSAGIFQLLVSLGVLWLSTQLLNARYWVVFSSRIREAISDYGASFSLVLFTVVVHLPQAADVEITLLEVPRQFGTTSGRVWLVELSALPTWAVFAAVIPGLITTLLFFFDHNVSSIMAQSRAFKLKHSPTFHWDFFVVGVCLLVSGLLGIPPTNGLIPQAPLHVKSLLISRRVRVVDVSCDGIKASSKSSGETGDFEVVGCYEQRVSNLMQAVLIGMMCFQPFLSVLKMIPTAALSGMFLFLGFASFSENSFAERMALLVTQPKLRISTSSFFDKVPFETVRIFTYIQMGILVVIFAVTLTPAVMVFPLLIGLLVPIRSLLLPRYFEDAHLLALDPLDKFTIEQDVDSKNSAILGHQQQAIDDLIIINDGGGDNRIKNAG